MEKEDFKISLYVHFILVFDFVSFSLYSFHPMKTTSFVLVITRFKLFISRLERQFKHWRRCVLRNVLMKMRLMHCSNELDK